MPGPMAGGGGIAMPGGVNSIPHRLQQRNLVIAAQTLDEFGAVVGGCTVTLMDPTTNLPVAQTTSDATTGAYSFPWSDGVTAYYIRAYRAGSPVYIGTTTPTLVAL